MNINATLLGQMITFAIFIWFSVKFVWPLLHKALDERRKKIADGLEAAERGQRDLELSQHKIKDQLYEARTQAAHIIEQANQRGNRLIEDAKTKAQTEGEHLITIAKNEITQEYAETKDKLRDQMATLAVACAEKVLQEKIDVAINTKLIDQVIQEIAGNAEYTHRE
ncbi:MAG: F0F1 ATP synthase subunit B [Gammaproteobacteria bacterium RIFOXYB2_FULL_38_6]|nr:MAG: F0F1 ATP synthase subunit B [Gammaproteobacteria bacterium RIFOXYB2_FULL_38_6]